MSLISRSSCFQLHKRTSNYYCWNICLFPVESCESRVRCLCLVPRLCAEMLMRVVVVEGKDAPAEISKCRSVGELPGRPHPAQWPLPSASLCLLSPKLRWGRPAASLQPEGSVGEGGRKKEKGTLGKEEQGHSFLPFRLPVQLPAQPKFSRDRPWILMRPHWVGAVWEEGCSNMKDQCCSSQGYIRRAGMSKAFLKCVALQEQKNHGGHQGCPCCRTLLGVHPSLCSE